MDSSAFGDVSVEAGADEINAISRRIIGATITVHARLGPGLLESAYETCLAYELKRSGLKVDTQLALPLRYDYVTLDIGYRVDMLVEDLIILELKACESVLPVHRAQLLSYLRLSGKRLGLLINFHEFPLKQGITRIVNKL